MINQYTFTNDAGWIISEPRPFNIGYAVLATPCIRPYGAGNTEAAGYHATHRKSYESPGFMPEESLVQKLTGRQLKFDYFSMDVLRQLLEERVALRDRNRALIQGQITNLSGDIYSASMLTTPDSDKRRLSLEKTKLDLESELREADERLWKDTAEVREKLITASRRFDGTYLRTGIFRPSPSDNDYNKGQGYTGFSG